MRRPAALTLAALFLFTVTFVYSQTQAAQTSQDQSGSEKSQKSEKPQSPEKAPSATEKPQSPENQHNPFDAFQQFSAVVSGGPLHWEKMNLYRSGNKMRAEYKEDYEIRISDLSKHRASFVRHRVDRPQKCGTLDKLDIATYPFFAYTGSDFKVERAPADEAAEKETVDGHSCKVENYTVKKTDGGMLVAKVKLWEADDLNGFPIRMEISPPATKTFNLYYTNVSLERPDPKLFQMPASCSQTKAQKSGASPSLKSKTSKPTASKPSPPQ